VPGVSGPGQQPDALARLLDLLLGLAFASAISARMSWEKSDVIRPTISPSEEFSTLRSSCPLFAS